MNFQTHFDREPHTYEEDFPTSRVNRFRHVPIRTQVENFILAGERLEKIRREAFDFPPGVEVDENYSDPTRAKGFDMADASMLEKRSMDSLNIQAVENAHKAAADASKAQDNVPGAVQQKVADPIAGNEPIIDKPKA